MGNRAHCYSSFYTVLDLSLQELWRGEVVQVSWKPRAFLLKSFMSEEECDHLVNKVS